MARRPMTISARPETTSGDGIGENIASALIWGAVSEKTVIGPFARPDAACKQVEAREREKWSLCCDLAIIKVRGSTKHLRDWRMCPLR